MDEVLRRLWESFVWILYAPDKNAWLQAGAQVLAGVLGVIGAFWVLTLQLRKDRDRKLVESGIELIQRRILQVRDLISEYRALSAIRPVVTEEDLKNAYEALAAVSLLYGYLQQKIGAKKLQSEERYFSTLLDARISRVSTSPVARCDSNEMDEVVWAKEDAPAMRSQLHGAFLGFYLCAGGDSVDSRDRHAQTQTWHANERNLAIIDSNLMKLYAFFDFAGRTIQKGNLPLVGRLPWIGIDWWRKRHLLQHYRLAIGGIERLRK